MAKPFLSAEQGSHNGAGVLPAKLAAPSHCLGLPEQAEQCQSQEKNVVSPNQHSLALLPQGLLGSLSSVLPARRRPSVLLPVPARPGSLTQQELPAGAPGCPQPGQRPMPLAVQSGALLGTDAGTRQTGT